METITSGILISAFKPAAVFAASRFRRAVSRRTSGATAEDIEIANRFDIPSLTDRTSTIGVVRHLPRNKTVRDFQEALHSPGVQGSIAEILAHHATHLGDPALELPREQFLESLADALKIEEIETLRAASDALFDELSSLSADLINRVRTADPDAYNRLEESGRLKLIISTIEAAKRRHDHTLDYRSSTSRKTHVEWLDQYRRQLITAHGHIIPPNIDDKQKIPIEDLYVAPEISLNEDERYHTVDIPHYTSTIDRTVLLGDPGGGKSTITAAIANHLAKTNLWTPFVVTLRDFARNEHSEKSILSYIELQLSVQYQCPAPAHAVESMLLNGEAFVIFDGLDELLDTSLRRTVSERVELFSTRYPLARLLATSRKVGYPEARLDPHVFQTDTIGGFSEEQVELYVRNWFSIAPHFATGTLETNVTAFLSESNQVPDLRRNPLMLSLICMIYRGQNYIPENRLRVLEKCSELLFHRWDRSRSIVVNFRASAHVDDALCHLAYWMYQSVDAAEGVTERDLITEATSFLAGSFRSRPEAVEAAREFISFCKGRAWVFGEAGTTSNGEPIFKFAHRTFLEYFTAHELTRRVDTPEKVGNELLPYVSRAEWDVVGQLAVQIVHSNTKNGSSRILKKLLGDGRRRKVENELNLLSFVGRCLSFSPASPDVSKFFIKKCLQNLLRQVEESSGDRISTDALDTLQNIHPDLLKYSQKDVQEALRDWLESTDSEKRRLARTIAVSYFHYTTRNLQEAKHVDDWRAWRDGFVRGNSELLLTSDCEAIHLVSFEQLEIITFPELLIRTAGTDGPFESLFSTLAEPLLNFFVIPACDRILRRVFNSSDSSTQPIEEFESTLNQLRHLANSGLVARESFPLISSDDARPHEDWKSYSLLFASDPSAQDEPNSQPTKLLTTRDVYWPAAVLTMARAEIDHFNGRVDQWPKLENELVAMAHARFHEGAQPDFSDTPLDEEDIAFINRWMSKKAHCLSLTSPVETID